MLQDEHPDKIAKACRNYQVDRLADKDAGSGNRNADLIIEVFENDMITPSSQPPCEKADEIPLTRYAGILFWSAMSRSSHTR